MKNLDEDITEVELKADGVWRPKLEGNARNSEPWRPSPASAATIVANGNKPAAAPGVLFNNPVKVEEGLSSHEHGSLRFRRTPDGHWALNGSKRNGGPSQQVMSIPRPTRSSSATDSNLKGDEDEHSVNQDPSEKNPVSMDENDEAEFSSRPREAPAGGWQASGGEPVSGSGADVIVLSDTDDEGGEEEAIVGSSGASMFAESDVVGNGRIRSSEVSIPNDTNGDSSGLALGLESADVTLASHSGSLPFNPLVSTRVGLTLPDEGTSLHSGLGLQLDTNSSFWAVPAENPRDNGDYRSYYPGQPEAGLHHAPPVRPTPVPAVAGSGFLSTSLIRDDSLQSGWKSYRPYGAVEGGSMDSETTASPLQNFLPAQPARAEVMSLLLNLLDCWHF